MREHFKDILHNQVSGMLPYNLWLFTCHLVRQVLNGGFCREFSKIEADLEKEGLANPLNELYRKTQESELGQAEKRVRTRLATFMS